MKRSRVKIILIMLITAIGFATAHFLFGLFTPYNYLTAKWDLINGKPRILQYGEAMVADKQYIEAAPQFGFTYDIVAGCVVSTPQVNGIGQYNSVMTGYLSEKLGNDWQQKFEDKADSLFKAQR